LIMPDKPLLNRPEPIMRSATATDLERLANRAEIITREGEVLTSADADNVDLVAWVVVANEMKRIANEMIRVAETELHGRVRQIAGPITTEYGTARESVSRGSVSGTNAARIRDVLERHAADGVIPWEAVDNVAPLTAHVTPAKLAQ
jgi:hypothetical protein